MFRLFTLAVFMIPATLLPAEMSSVAAQATYRIPKTGTPALSVVPPPGWAAAYDENGNLQLHSADNLAYLQLSILTAADAAATPASTLATAILKGTQAEPYDRTELDSIDGRSGRAFISKTIIDGRTIDVRVVIANVDAADDAVSFKIIRRDAPAADIAALNSLASQVKIVR
jgi:hypothetical protein